MKSVARPAIIASALMFATVAPAYAYIDPGSGMMVLQGLLAAGALALAFVRNPIAFFRARFSRDKKKTDHEDQKDDRQ